MSGSCSSVTGFFFFFLTGLLPSSTDLGVVISSSDLHVSGSCSSVTGFFFFFLTGAVDVSSVFVATIVSWTGSPITVTESLYHEFSHEIQYFLCKQDTEKINS